MFYSETLLSKTGPLARVWLSANLERKLSKSHILQSNIETSVSAIVDQGQAPMALRLSGQLLLGVVRIYSRKARYLLDDCNEALLKIKMAFRPGNVDLPTNQINASNSAALTLPDAITELDLLPPIPDASLLLTNPSAAPDLDLDRERPGRNEDITLMDWGSPRLQSSIEVGRNFEEGAQLEDDVLDLDIGDDPMDGIGDETSVHMGREAPAARGVEDDIISGGFLEGGDLDTTLNEDAARKDGLASPLQNLADEPLNFVGDDDMDFDVGRDVSLHIEDQPAAAAPVAAPTPGRLERESQSPLSSIRSSEERNLEQDYRRNLDSTIFEPDHEEEEESLHQPQRAKRRKILQPDSDTVLHNQELKEQQLDRSKILKPASFLPRDPMLLTLMSMQRNGGFVSSILGEGRGKGWAPELRGILSLEVVRKSGELKRKRDQGIVDTDGEHGSAANGGKQPRLELEGLDEDLELPAGGPVLEPDTTIGGDGEIIDLPADDGMRPPSDDGPLRQNEGQLDFEEDGEAGNSPAQENFDETLAPLVHPADSGPVSLGTKHAVHLLRDRFGSSPASGTPSQQKKAGTVVFQDLLPEATTSKADATKMFFEVLVLATKDAVKVEQADGALGGPIRVRGKRGLWGSWAETEAGGEIAETDHDNSQQASNHLPSAPTSTTVAVEA
ncbi:MAG: sister chromatid cohesion protein 1 [Sclerophora amabilis]|nr:MAG: sister chromatid cohesion protein 1 [Sclerophora amabilis]